MNLLYPKLGIRLFGRMFVIALLGAWVAGIYGVLHDQVTYSISPEYFTKMKFDQFDYADFGFPRRFFVAEIGFLATWWVGFFAGWFLARVALPVWPMRVAMKKCVNGFGLIFLTALVAAVVGYGLGVMHSGDYSFWVDLTGSLGIVDVRDFVRVALIHNASYLGGLIGLLAAIALMFRAKKAAMRPV